MAALGNPSESLIDAYVAVAQRPCISLEALMALLCACPLLVRVPVDTRVHGALKCLIGCLTWHKPCNMGRWSCARPRLVPILLMCIRL